MPPFEPPPPPFFTTTTLLTTILTILLALLYALYRAALPKPIPHIPHHAASATRILGDVPPMLAFTSKHGTFTEWMTRQSTELGSPVYQLFLKPFCKPAVFVTDPREAQDVLLRRTGKDFDRSKFFKNAFVGTMPNHHIVQSTNDKFRAGRRILQDTMASGFLNNVAAPCLHKHTMYLMELWGVKARAAQGHAFAVAEDINHMALDSIWDVAFGSELRTLPEEITFLRNNLANTTDAVRRSETQTAAAAAAAAATLPKPEYNISVRSMLIITDGLDMAATSPFPKQAHWLLRQTPRYRRARAYKTKLIQERIADAKRRVLSSTPAATEPSLDNNNNNNNDDDDASEFHGITCATDHLVRRETLAAKKENRAPAYDSPEAKDELFGFLIGGHDTTATTMMWAIKFLADDPRTQSKLRHVLRTEAYPSFGALAASSTLPAATNVPTAGAIAKTHCPYLDAVVEEIFRCAGTAASAVRQATRDTTLLGYPIPKGTDVYFMSNGPGYIQSNSLNELITEEQRSPTSREFKDKAVPAWDEGDIAEFQPERWLKTSTTASTTLDGEKKKTTTSVVFDVRSGPVLQFGGGLRGCFGKRMAYLEMRILVVLLVWMYELVQVPEELGGNAAFDSLTHKPKNCYLLLRELKG